MAAVPEPLKFKEVDENFSCDCNTRDHSLYVMLMDDRCLVIDALDETALNTPWHWRLASAAKLFWDYFWNKEHSIEIVLNRQEHRKWKKFFENLQDDRCWNCNPDYLAKGNYFKHNH